MPWTSNTAAVFFTPPSLTSQLSSVKQPCHSVCLKSHQQCCLLVPPQHSLKWVWSIFNSLEAAAIGILSTCSPSWLASNVLTWPSEDCNSQNICTYCTAQAMRQHCLKATHFPQGAGYSLPTQQGCRGMQGTRLLAPAGPALRWTARHHDSAPDGYQELTDHSS